MVVKSSCLGFPRIGAQRELKKAVEAYWAGKADSEALLKVSADLRRQHWQLMQKAAVDFIPSHDFSLYDHVLDTAVMVGAIPERFKALSNPLDRYFAMARGVQKPGVDLPALEMTKWFDTNYHYIVPEIAAKQSFRLDSTKILAEVREAKKLGIQTRPVILGPVTFLTLSKWAPGVEGSKNGPVALLADLLPVYDELLGLLAQEGVEWVQIDEPALVTDLQDDTTRVGYQTAFRRLAALKARPKLMLATYFGALAQNAQLSLDSGFEALHIDLVRGPEQLKDIVTALPASMTLSVGVIDGRNIWCADLDAAHRVVQEAVKTLGAGRVIVASSCSLLHSPVDLAFETHLDPQVKSWMAFATQKLQEIVELAHQAAAPTPSSPLFTANRAARRTRADSPLTKNPEVRKRAEAVTDAMLRRSSVYPKRAAIQHARFHLPPFPTTTIGSFPQTGDVRAMRASWRSHKVTDAAYDQFLKEETKRCIERQMEIGLDVLVHGEFERTDMVEYFGEKLAGFAFTANGWVQSYGSRCVKPPVIYGDVARPQPMTVTWAKYAQSLSKAPVKGMLTGPVTILQWSFVRDDQPRAATCRQIALALRDEVVDLEAAGIAMIQVDEPAIREGLPLRHRQWAGYLEWAVDSFRLSTAGVRDETQIHTHMCYSEFADILSAIAAMDADVLSIETSRSHKELLSDFERFSYPNEIGLGVYDIHSPRIPTITEITSVLQDAAKLLPAERLWVNPDCGLKTRSWTEVEPALSAMVAAAKEVRKHVQV